MIVEKEKALAINIQVMGKDLETVESFKYLGIKITAGGKFSDEVRSRLAMVTSSLINPNGLHVLLA